MTYDCHARPTPDDRVDTAAIRKAIQAELKDRDYRLEKLREVVQSLPQKNLGTDGARLAKLPDGTNVVTLPDGAIRLALPVRISGIGGTPVGGESALTVIRKGEDVEGG